MEEYGKVIATILFSIAFSFGSAYVYVRISLATLHERIKAQREQHEDRNAQLNAQLIDVKTDLQNHKDKIYKKIDDVLDELKELRREMHEYMMRLKN